MVNFQDQTEVTIAGNLLEFMAISESAVIFGQFNHPSWDKVTHDLRRLMTDGVHKGICYHKERVSEEVADRILAPTQPYIIDALLKEFELPPTEKKRNRHRNIRSNHTKASSVHRYYACNSLNIK